MWKAYLNKVDFFKTISCQDLQNQISLKKSRFPASLEKLEDTASLSPHFLLATMAETECMLPISDGYLPFFLARRKFYFILASLIIHYIKRTKSLILFLF